MNCLKCGADMEYKEGISKVGKPYKMWLCNSCKNIQWVKDNIKPAPASPATTQTYTPKSNGYTKGEADIKSILLSYAKDVVVAEIAAGKETLTPFKRIADGLKLLLLAYKDPFASDTEKFEKETEEVKLPF